MRGLAIVAAIAAGLAAGCAQTPTSPYCNNVDLNISNVPYVDLDRLAVGDSLWFHASITDYCQRGLGWRFLWKSTMPTVATIDSSGLFVARTPGTTDISVAAVATTGEQRKGTRTVTVVGESSPPTGRAGHTAIYDPVRDRMVIFGGFDEFSRFRNDVYALELADMGVWTHFTPVGTPPIGRYDHSAIYDPVYDRMVAYGGGGSAETPDLSDDVWTLSLAGAPAWLALTPTGTPPSAPSGSYHSAIYDPLRARLIVLGEMYAPNEVRALSLAGAPAWTVLTPTGTPPGYRRRTSAIYDPVRDRIVVFGGDDGSNPSNEVWTLSLAGTPSWMKLTPTGTPPSGREEHTAIYDPVRDRMVVFGGRATPGYHSEVWALSLAGTPAWTDLTPLGLAPSARVGHSAIYDPVRDRMVVFGGDDGRRRSDVWALSLAGSPVWTEITPSEAPPF
jgi:hypothetical protein